jgi:mannose-6-phosphate isomerase-like protein (cupin superfamily)
MDPKWAAFRLSEIDEQRRREGGDSWLEFLKVPSLRTGLYVLPAGSVDTQSPHTEDEVYYVVRGRGRFTADGNDRNVEAGAVLFVAAHVEHRFHSIEEDLEIVVFFART